MPTITIPKNLETEEELMVIPKREYEELLHAKLKIAPTVQLTPKQKKAIEESEKELKRGEYITLQQLKDELGHPHTKTSQ